MSQSSDADGSAIRLLREAIELCRHCYGYWRDERLWGDGHDIDYAVDVDVLVMFSDPLRHASHAKTFTTQDAVADRDLASLLARCLADFIFCRFSPGNGLSEDQSQFASSVTSLALLAPHDQEWTRVSVAIGAEIATDIRDAGQAVDALQGLDALYATSERSTADVSKYLSDNASQILRVLDSRSGASAQVKRLNALPARKIVTLQKHPSFSGEHVDRLPPKLRAASPDFLKLEDMADEWYRLMLEFKDGSARLHNVEDDAWALARLEWINATAVMAGEKRRMILISGTDRLFRACERRRSLHDPSQNFAETYLRYPLAFLGARDFFAREDQGGHDEFRLRAWLAVLFPNVVKQRRVVPESTRAFASRIDVSLDEEGITSILGGDSEMVARALALLNEQGYRSRTEGQFPESALREWAKVVRSTSINQDMSLSAAERSGHWSDLVHRLASAPDASSMKDLIREELGKRIQTSFLALYRSIDILGTVQALTDGQQMRGLPALRFDVDEEHDANEQYEELCRKLWEERPEQFDLHQLYASLARSDASNYRATVIHAFICASSDLWFQARTLCRVALLIVGELPAADRAKRSGREAAYLLAVAERRLSNSMAGLAVAESALNEAIKRANGPEKGDVRFRSERLALKLGRLQYARYVDKSSSVMPAADALALISEAEQICKDISPTADSASVQSWVIRQSVTNASIAGLLAYASGMRSTQLTGGMRAVLALLHDRDLSPALAPDRVNNVRWQDEISDFVFLVASTIFDADDNRVRSARTLLSQLSRDHSSRKAVSMRLNSALIYEEIRRTEFLRMAGIIES